TRTGLSSDYTHKAVQASEKSSKPRTGNQAVTPLTRHPGVASVHDPCPTGSAGGHLAESISLRGDSFRAMLRQRRDARRYRVETRLPLGADRMQDLAFGFSGRPRQALPSKIRTRVRVRTLLPHSAAFV